MRQFATNEREAKAAGGACSSRGPLLTGDARARAKPSCMECGIVLRLGFSGACHSRAECPTNGGRCRGIEAPRGETARRCWHEFCSEKPWRA